MSSENVAENMQVLALRRQQGEDLLDVGQEAHVEHPVRLVEDEDLDLAQVRRPAGRRGRAAGPGVATRISTPPRRALVCGSDRHAAVDDGRPERDGPAVGPDALVDLHRELAGRDEDEGADRVAGRREARVRVLAQPVEDRQREGRGLAGAGLGGGEDVASLEDEGDGCCLDRRRGGVALLGDGPEEVGRQAERIEGQAGSCVGPGRAARVWERDGAGSSWALGRAPGA